MVEDHSDSERGNPLPPHGLLFPISSKGSFSVTKVRVSDRPRVRRALAPPTSLKQIKLPTGHGSVARPCTHDRLNITSCSVSVPVEQILLEQQSSSWYPTAVIVPFSRTRGSVLLPIPPQSHDGATSPVSVMPCDVGSQAPVVWSRNFASHSSQ